jgi:hypothetical protein
MQESLMKMDCEVLEEVRGLHRHLNSVEHMIYVSCKFTRTTEMLKKVMSSILKGYEFFFEVGFSLYVNENENVEKGTIFNKITLLKDYFYNAGIELDLSEYFLLKRLLVSEFECVGEYRKNLAIIAYIDGEELSINVMKLIEFFTTLKTIINNLSKLKKNINS